MVTYQFYKEDYKGVSIPSVDEFERLAMRADTEINAFERTYRITGKETARNMVLCAIADEIYGVEAIVSQSVATSDGEPVGAISSVSVGNVSTTYKSGANATELGVDMTERGLRRRYYSLLCKYMKVYRGVRKCR